MNDAALEAVLLRDRMVVLAALIAVAALAWVYVLRLAAMMHPEAGMSGMDVAAMNMADMANPGLRPWGVLPTQQGSPPAGLFEVHCKRNA